MIEVLINFFRKIKKKRKEKSREGFAQIVGAQEYDNMIRELYKDKQIDVNNHAANYAFIQDFVVTHVKGIHLIKGDNG